MSAPTATEIAQLQADAARAQDPELVESCKRALAGDPEALEICAEILADIRAGL